MAQDRDGIERKREILRKELYDSLEETVGLVERRLRSLVPGLLGGLLNPVVSGLFQWVGKDRVRERGRRMIDFVLERAARSGSVDQIAAGTFEEFLEVDEIWNRVKRDHPKAAEMKELVRKAYENRLKGVRGLLHGEGTTWVELARSGFPERRELEALCDEQLALGERMAKLMERHPDMVRAPRFMGREVLRKEVVRILKDVVTHGDRMLKGRMGEIYKNQTSNPKS